MKNQIVLPKINKVKCAVCRKSVAPDCDWDQGRCPHRPPMTSFDRRLLIIKKFFQRRT